MYPSRIILLTIGRPLLKYSVAIIWNVINYSPAARGRRGQQVAVVVGTFEQIVRYHLRKRF